MENQQAVVEESDVTQEASTEDGNAQDLELDNLLEEYSATSETEETKPQESITEESETKQLLNTMKLQMEATQRATSAKELDETVKSIKGELGVEDKYVKAFLNMKAEDDPRLAQAYLAKEKNPAAWAKIEKTLRGDLQKFIGGIADKDATETRDAVVSSVLNSKSSSSETDAPDMSKMSDVEFENFKNEEFKKAGRAF